MLRWFLCKRPEVKPFTDLNNIKGDPSTDSPQESASQPSKVKGLGESLPKLVLPMKTDASSASEDSIVGPEDDMSRSMYSKKSRQKWSVSPHTRWSCSKIRVHSAKILENIDLGQRSETEKQRQKNIDQQWSDEPFNFDELTLNSNRSGNGLKKIPLYIINPGGVFRVTWDMLLLLLLGYIAMVTPIRLGFSQDAEGVLWMFEALMDIFFLGDVLLNFLTAYRDNENVLQTRIKAITCNYLGGFFFIDLVSSIPFDLVMYFADGGESAGFVSQASTVDTAKTLKAGKLGRVVKMIKFSKLLRLARSFGIGQRMVHEFEFAGDGPLTVVRLFVVTLVVAHLNACCWAYLAQSGSDGYGDDSWMVESGVSDGSIAQQYLNALHWSSTMLMTAGSSGVVPRNDLEVGYSIAMVILGGFYYSFVIASLSALFNQTEGMRTAVLEKVASVDMYLKKRHIPKKLSIRVLKFYQHFYSSKELANEDTVLGHLSVNLRNDVATYVSEDIFHRSHLFAHLDHHSKTKLLSIMRPFKSHCGDIIYRAGDRDGMEIYVVLSGVVHVFFSGHEATESIAERKKNRKKRTRTRHLLGGGNDTQWEGCAGCKVQEERTGMPCAGVLEIRAGSSFGELCAFGVTNIRISTAEAMETAEMYTFHRDDLADLFQKSAPHVLIHLVRVAKEHLNHLSKRFGFNVAAIENRALETKQDEGRAEMERETAKAETLQDVLTSVMRTQNLMNSLMARQRSGEEALRKTMVGERKNFVNHIDERLNAMATKSEKSFAKLCSNIVGLSKVIRRFNKNHLQQTDTEKALAIKKAMQQAAAEKNAALNSALAFSPSSSAGPLSRRR